ncbi:hypothetical protein CR513_03249, partial [Mucuna pruriens]
MKPDVALKIKEEWVANIVLVPKKDEKIRMCVDYRDLNRASPKDNFLLPHIDVLINNTAQHVFFSFMDGQRKDNLHHLVGNLLLQGDAIRAQECWSNIAESYSGSVP